MWKSLILLLYVFLNTTAIAQNGYWNGIGILEKAPKGNQMYLKSNIGQQKFILTRHGKFNDGDTVFVSGHITRHYFKEITPRIHVKEIKWYDCCPNGFKGDIDSDGNLDIADIIILSVILKENLTLIICSEQIDIDDNGIIGNSDLEYLLNYAFNDGPPPPPCE